MPHCTDRRAEAERRMRRHFVIFLNFTHQTGHLHPHLKVAIGNYELLLQAMGRNEQEIRQRLDEMKRALG